MRVAVERKIAGRLAQAGRNGLAGIHFWAPSAEELAAFSQALQGTELSPEGWRLHKESVAMLEESINDAEGRAWLKLAAAVDAGGRVLAFALVDDGSDEHGFEVITLAAEEGKGFGSALLAALGRQAGGELYLDSEAAADEFYDAMGMQEGDGWRLWGREDCAKAALLLEQSGITIFSQAPQRGALVQEL